VAAGLYRTTGATFQGNSFGATGTTFGVYATGTSTGTTFISNTLARNVVGLHLAAATELEFGRVGTGNTISGSTFAGLEAGGACTGSVVLATSWSTNVVNVINKATGLTVNPA
jgi:nitrous oxidase accessory protein NosD